VRSCRPSPQNSRHGLAQHGRRPVYGRLSSGAAGGEPWSTTLLRRGRKGRPQWAQSRSGSGSRGGSRRRRFACSHVLLQVCRVNSGTQAIIGEWQPAHSTTSWPAANSRSWSVAHFSWTARWPRRCGLSGGRICTIHITCCRRERLAAAVAADRARARLGAPFRWAAVPRIIGAVPRDGPGRYDWTIGNASEARDGRPAGHRLARQEHSSSVCRRRA
jgi:hypothetical protein